MSRRTGAQRRQCEEADRRAYQHKANFEKQRAASEAVANDANRAWAKRSHSVARACERYGVVTDMFRLRRIERMIQTGQVCQPGLILLGHVKDNFNRRSSVWIAQINNRMMPLVYDHDAAAVTTFLPIDGKVLRFEHGGFVYMVGGGTKAGREYWSAIQ